MVLRKDMVRLQSVELFHVSWLRTNNCFEWLGQMTVCLNIKVWYMLVSLGTSTLCLSAIFAGCGFVYIYNANILCSSWSEEFKFPLLFLPPSPRPSCLPSKHMYSFPTLFPPSTPFICLSLFKDKLLRMKSLLSLFSWFPFCILKYSLQVPLDRRP